MSVGRYIMRPRVFQGRAFAGWALANSGVPVSVQILTTRLTILGTSSQRMAIGGTSSQRRTILGTSAERLELEGSSP
jgi:hypothetical protein